MAHQKRSSLARSARTVGPISSRLSHTSDTSSYIPQTFLLSHLSPRQVDLASSLEQQSVDFSRQIRADGGRCQRPQHQPVYHGLQPVLEENISLLGSECNDDRAGSSAEVSDSAIVYHTVQSLPLGVSGIRDHPCPWPSSLHHTPSIVPLLEEASHRERLRMDVVHATPFQSNMSLEKVSTRGKDATPCTPDDQSPMPRAILPVIHTSASDETTSSDCAYNSSIIDPASLQCATSGQSRMCETTSDISITTGMDTLHSQKSNPKRALADSGTFVFASKTVSVHLNADTLFLSVVRDV